MSIDEMKPSVRSLHKGVAHVVKFKIDRVMITSVEVKLKNNL